MAGDDDDHRVEGMGALSARGSCAEGNLVGAWVVIDVDVGSGCPRQEDGAD